MTVRHSVLDDVIIIDMYLSGSVASKALFTSLNTLDNIKKILNLEHFYAVINRIFTGLLFGFNTLRTGDADLRFYITTVQDG